MSETAADVTRHLAARAEDVCRYYLSNGRREGRTWRVGDIDNTPGRSLCVQLTETSRTAAGRWIDFATSEYGDLLDLIARAQRLDTFRDVVDEARQFLSLPERSIEPMERDASLGSDGYWHVRKVVLPFAGRWHVRIDALVTEHQAELLAAEDT